MSLYVVYYHSTTLISGSSRRGLSSHQPRRPPHRPRPGLIPLAFLQRAFPSSSDSSFLFLRFSSFSFFFFFSFTLFLLTVSVQLSGFSLHPRPSYLHSFIRRAGFSLFLLVFFRLFFPPPFVLVTLFIFSTPTSSPRMKLVHRATCLYATFARRELRPARNFSPRSRLAPPLSRRRPRGERPMGSRELLARAGKAAIPPVPV